jgi:adenosylcobinamide-phosphate synthase
MAAGAGALKIKLGGNAIYDGKVKTRHLLGVGTAPIASDILRAWKMVQVTIVWWCFIALLLGGILRYFL